MNIKECQISYSDCPDLKNLTIGLHLDYPVSGLDEHQMVLAGWVLPNNPDDKVAIIVRNGEKHTEHEPNKERPDVIEKVLKPRFPNHRDSKVGFALPIEPTDKFGVSVRINHSEFPWFEVKFQNRGTSTIEDMAKNLAENKQEFLYYDNYAKGEIGEIHKWGGRKN